MCEQVANIFLGRRKLYMCVKMKGQVQEEEVKELLGKEKIEEVDK